MQLRYMGGSLGYVPVRYTQGYTPTPPNYSQAYSPQQAPLQGSQQFAQRPSQTPYNGSFGGGMTYTSSNIKQSPYTALQRGKIGGFSWNGMDNEVYKRLISYLQGLRDKYGYSRPQVDTAPMRRVSQMVSNYGVKEYMNNFVHPMMQLWSGV